MTTSLEMSVFVKYRYGKSKPFAAKKVSAIAPQKSSCFRSLITCQSKCILTVFHSTTIKC